MESSVNVCLSSFTSQDTNFTDCSRPLVHVAAAFTNDPCLFSGFVSIVERVPRRQPHRRSGLATPTLPSMGAVQPHITVDYRGLAVFCVHVCLLYVPSVL